MPRAKLSNENRMERNGECQADSSLNQSQHNRSNDERHTWKVTHLLCRFPLWFTVSKDTLAQFQHVHIVCDYVFACGLWVGGYLVEYSSRWSTADVVPNHNNMPKWTWKRQNECTEIANNFSCRAQQKELDAKWSIWILHKSGWTSSGALVFVSTSEKNPDFIHNAFIVLTPALIVPNNALQPKHKATLDTSAFSNSSICWTLALVIQSACLYATQSRQEPQHVHFKSTDSK